MVFRKLQHFNTTTLFSMKNIITCFLMVICASCLVAQEIDFEEVKRCATDEWLAEKMQDAAFRQAFLEQTSLVEQQLAQTLQMPCADPLIVPVAVHYNTPITDANPQCLIDQALDQVAQLNLDFSLCNMNADVLCTFAEACPDYFDVPINELLPEEGACIQFCLGDQNLPAGEDNIGGYAITVGDYIWTGNNSDTQNNWDGFLNIFVANTDPSGALGVAPLNGGANPSGDGVYVFSEAFGGSGGPCSSGAGLDVFSPFTWGATATHEVGHYFGLNHPWQDNLADTPAQSTPNYGCPVYNTSTCTTTEGSDFSSNFMDYVNDFCMSNFSADQVARMRAVAANQSAWATDKISCYADWQNGTTTYMSCQSVCNSEACATEATSIYIQIEEVCGGSAYELPTNYEEGGLTLDKSGGATYTWSTGGYLPSGTAITGTTYTPDAPTGCASRSEFVYLNVGCGSDASVQIDAGVISLTTYPDPTQLSVADIVTFTDGDCNGPTWDVTPACASFVTVTQNGGPTFPVTSGSGTINYDIEVAYPETCCMGAVCSFTASANYTCNSGGNCEADSGDW